MTTTIWPCQVQFGVNWVFAHQPPFCVDIPHTMKQYMWNKTITGKWSTPNSTLPKTLSIMCDKQQKQCLPEESSLGEKVWTSSWSCGHNCIQGPRLVNLTMRGLHVSMMNQFFLVSKGFQKNLGKKLRKKSKNVVTSSTPGGRSGPRGLGLSWTVFPYFIWILPWNRD